MGSIGQYAGEKSFIQDVVIENVWLLNGQHGARLKSWAGPDVGYGYINNITFRNFWQADNQYAAYLDSCYFNVSLSNSCPKSHTPQPADAFVPDRGSRMRGVSLAGQRDQRAFRELLGLYVRQVRPGRGLPDVQFEPRRRVRQHHVQELHRDEPLRERHGERRRRHLRQHQGGCRDRLCRIQQHRGRRRAGGYLQRSAGDPPGAYAVAEAPQLRRCGMVKGRGLDRGGRRGVGDDSQGRSKEPWPFQGFYLGLGKVLWLTPVRSRSPLESRSRKQGKETEGSLGANRV